jgi:hypothetical protein
MPWDDLEPIELEPVDLEMGDDDSQFERGPRTNRTRAWLAAGIVGIGLAAWAAVALTTKESRPRPSATPATTAPPATFARVDAVTQLTPVLRSGLRHIGSGRFAAVIEDRLYILDTRLAEQHQVALPEGHATIDDQSGPSLSVSTFQETLVSTQPTTTRVLSAHDIALRAVEPAQWWLLRDDRTVRNDRTRETVLEPDGLRVSAVLEQGFVALDLPHSRWVLWSPSSNGTTTKPLAPIGYKLIGSGARSIVFWYGSSLAANEIEIVEPPGTATVTTLVPGIPQFAGFSPDGTRLAVASTLGQVVILDSKTGSELAVTQSIRLPSPSVSFTWTPDGRSLLVVQDHRIEIHRAADGLTTNEIEIPEGLQQLVALP